MSNENLKKYSLEKLEEKRRHLLSMEKYPVSSGKITDHVHYPLGVEFFEDFHGRSLSVKEREQIISDYVKSLPSEKMQGEWQFAIASALSMPMILKTQEPKGERVSTETLDKLAQDLSQMREVERTFVLAVIDKITPAFSKDLTSRIDPVKGAMLNTVKPFYEHATSLQGRQLENAVRVNPGQKYKNDYQALVGDSLKTNILADLKSLIDKANSPEELQDLKKTAEYKTLEKRQGPNWLNYIPFLKTDSVKAFDSMVAEAEERIENKAKVSLR